MFIDYGILSFQIMPGPEGDCKSQGLRSPLASPWVYAISQSSQKSKTLSIIFNIVMRSHIQNIYVNHNIFGLFEILANDLLTFIIVYSCYLFILVYWCLALV